MNRAWSIPWPSLLAALAIAAPAAGQSDEFPVYVGRSVCRDCHGRQRSAGPCTLHDIPEHDKAFKALTSPPAEHIAALNGMIEPPPTSRLCLDCHAAAADEGPRWTAPTFQASEGVQCESCHGAGSFHAAIYRGQPQPCLPWGDRLIEPGDRARCIPCHVKKPSHQEVLEYGYEIAPADRHYKTPVNLAVSPDGQRLYVVCEDADSLIVVDTGTRAVLQEITVGRRPHDVAVSPCGSTLYVTNRMSGTLSVIDTATHRVTHELGVGHEPHGVLTDENGRRIFVLNAGDNTIAVLAADTLEIVNRLVAGDGPWSLALRDEGRTLINTSVRPQPARFRDPPVSEITITEATGRRVTRRLDVPDGNMLQGIAAVPGRNVTLFTLMRTKNLVPLTRLLQGWAITNGLGVVGDDGRVDQVLLDEPDHYFPDPMDVAVSPDGRMALVTSGGADEVAVVDITKLLEVITTASDEHRRDVLPNHLGTAKDIVVKRLAVGTNPRGVAYAPDGRRAYVVNTLDDSVSVVDTDDYHVTGTIGLGGPETITELRRGARVFHSADAAYGRQFSCHGCHPDGHVNGLTFDIEPDGLGMRPVDNRTLRSILDTPPFKWEGINPSLFRQCGPRLAVFFTRLDPYSPQELQALVRYMCTIEQPPNRFRRPDGLTDAQRRGKAVFERKVSNLGRPLKPQERCVHCHVGAHRTSREMADVGSTMWFDADVDVDLSNLFNADEFGELGTYYFIDVGMPASEFDVAHLRNINDSPPYLHNGGAATLEEIWTRFNMVNRHGMTSDLTRQQYNDLIAYLKAL